MISLRPTTSPRALRFDAGMSDAGRPPLALLVPSAITIETPLMLPKPPSRPLPSNSPRYTQYPAVGGRHIQPSPRQRTAEPRERTPRAGLLQGPPSSQARHAPRPGHVLVLPVFILKESSALMILLCPSYCPSSLPLPPSALPIESSSCPPVHLSSPPPPPRSTQSLDPSPPSSLRPGRLAQPPPPPPQRRNLDGGPHPPAAVRRLAHL